MTTLKKGGLIVAISPFYLPASQGAGFYFVQASMYLPPLHSPEGDYFLTKRIFILLDA